MCTVTKNKYPYYMSKNSSSKYQSYFIGNKGVLYLYSYIL